MCIYSINRDRRSRSGFWIQIAYSSTSSRTYRLVCAIWYLFSENRCWGTGHIQKTYSVRYATSRLIKTIIKSHFFAHIFCCCCFLFLYFLSIEVVRFHLQYIHVIREGYISLTGHKLYISSHAVSVDIL